MGNGDLPVRTVLIADDEMPSRELLKMSCDWPRNGFGQLLEARDGEEALALYRAWRPYLVITDIKMPVMDGLDLIRAIREIDPKQRVLVLSCHEDFHFAREALKMGVLDYILKDSYTPESLQATLDRALREDGSERGRYLSQRNPLRMMLEDSASGAQAQALFSLVHNNTQAYFICAARFASPHFAAEMVDGVLQRLYHMLDEQSGGDVFIRKEQVYVLFCLPDTASAARRESFRVCMSKQLRALLEDCFGPVAAMGVSALFKRDGQLALALKQTERAVSNHFFLPGQYALFFDKMQDNAKDVGQSETQDKVTQIRQSLQRGDKAALLQTLDALYRALGDIKSMEALQHVNAMMMSLLTQSCAAKALSFEEIFGVERISLNMLDELSTLDAIHEWFKARFVALMDAGQSTLSPRIRKIVAFIEQHSREDLSLDNVAQRFGMHKVYLAKVFKDETAKSVNEYIRAVRMEQAKLLLEKGHMKISAVVETLGFNNAQTFYNLFRKHTGMSPSEYKTMCDLRRAAT